MIVGRVTFMLQYLIKICVHIIHQVCESGMFRFHLSKCVKVSVLFFVVVGFAASHSQITTEKWFKSMKNVLEILNSSHAMQCSEETEERLQMYQKLSKLEATNFGNFLDRKLRSALHTFLTISDSDMLSKNGPDLLFLNTVVFEGDG